MTGVIDLFSSDYIVNSNSLLTAPGMRWVLRNAVLSIDAAPWGTIVMFIVMAGLMRGSGISAMLSHLIMARRLTKNEKRSLFFALVSLVVYLAVLYVGKASSWEVFTGVSADVSSSPLVQGWVMLALIGVLFVSMTYGLIYGNFRSLVDAVSSIGDTFVLAVPALMAVIPASWLISCLQYTGIVENDFILCGNIIYALPFAYVVILNALADREVD
jgi:p-aminobenzoyl-glutamate transporter AbgT